jgi:hypothetical protein
MHLKKKATMTGQGGVVPNDDIEEIEWPLLLEAIAGDTSRDQIGIILDHYEEACMAKQASLLTFLNCSFLMPAANNMKLRGTERLVLSPLHVAVQARRDNIVELLLARGADASQSAVVKAEEEDAESFTPFSYAIELSGNSDEYFRTEDFARDARFENAALVLASHLLRSSGGELKNAQAYHISETGDISISEFTRNVICAGMPRLCILFLDRWKNVSLTDDLLIVNARNNLLRRTLNNMHPAMAQLVRYLFEDGAVLQRYILSQDSMISRALNQENDNTVLEIIRYQLDRSPPSAVIESLYYELRYRAMIDDKHYDLLTGIAREFINRNRDDGPLLLLRLVIVGGKESIKSREFLLNNAKVINGETLRYAIRVRDNTTVDFMIRWFLNNSRDIDEQIVQSEPAYYIGDDKRQPREFFGTILGFALGQENYYAVAHLLSVGANPSLVAPNIRSRVRVSRDRLQQARQIDPLLDITTFSLLFPQLERQQSNRPPLQ